jgi:hypothetical protein
MRPLRGASFYHGPPRRPKPGAAPARTLTAMDILSRIIGRLRGETPGAPQRLPSPDALVLLTRPYGEAQAQLFRDMLEQEGVRSLIKNRDPVSARAGGMGPPWAYELWVLRRDLRRAREILALSGDTA